MKPKKRKVVANLMGVNRPELDITQREAALVGPGTMRAKCEAVVTTVEKVK